MKDFSDFLKWIRSDENRINYDKIVNDATEFNLSQNNLSTFSQEQIATLGLMIGSVSNSAAIGIISLYHEWNSLYPSE